MKVSKVEYATTDVQNNPDFIEDGKKPLLNVDLDSYDTFESFLENQKLVPTVNKIKVNGNVEDFVLVQKKKASINVFEGVLYRGGYK